MSTQQEKQQHSEPNVESELLEAVVRDNVMFDLGCPTGLHHVQVRCLWGDHYRVNVYVGEDAASAIVAHSYFLKADGNGKILTASPVITRVY